MPCPHNEITIVQRSQRQSAVAAAAYQSGEKLFCEYDQQVKHYPEKRGIVHNEILLPANAPPEYADRNTLWNAAEAVEKQWNSQLARRWVLTIPREIPPDQYAVLVREFCEQQFVSKGMIADFAIHDPHPPGHNPHAHVMLTMRAMDEHGKWLPKSRKVYDLDESGERIKLPSPIFIFVFRWGIQGAALATIIGQIVSGVIALAYLPRFSHFAIRKKYLRLKWRFIGDIVRLGFPSLCTQTATAATQIVMNNLMRKYGAATIYGSEIALSCYGLMMKIYQIAHAMFVGLASGTQPINGFNFGARQYERVKQTIQTAAKISIGISVLWFLVFRYGGGFLAALFVEEEPLYQEFAVHCFRLYMLGFFVYGLPNVTASFFQAIGSPVKSLMVSLSRQVIFLIPFALLLSAHFGMDGALGAASVADVLAFLLAALLLKRELRGWKKKNMIA